MSSLCAELTWSTTSDGFEGERAHMTCEWVWLRVLRVLMGHLAKEVNNRTNAKYYGYRNSEIIVFGINERHI